MGLTRLTHWPLSLIYVSYYFFCCFYIHSIFADYINQRNILWNNIPVVLNTQCEWAFLVDILDCRENILLIQAVINLLYKFVALFVFYANFKKYITNLIVWFSVSILFSRPVGNGWQFHYLLSVPTGYYNTIELLEAIALHLDSVNGKPCIWEELVSCFLRLFSEWTTDYGDCMSCNVQGDATFTASSKFSCVFFEQNTRETWKVRCTWWMNRHFSQSICTSETLTGTCLLLDMKWHDTPFLPLWSIG